jgi:hypothetical protein
MLVNYHINIHIAELISSILQCPVHNFIAAAAATGCQNNRAYYHYESGTQK